MDRYIPLVSRELQKANKVHRLWFVDTWASGTKPVEQISLFGCSDLPTHCTTPQVMPTQLFVELSYEQTQPTFLQIMDFCRDQGVIFCSGLGINEDTLSDTASEITVSLELQTQSMSCKGISTAVMFTILFRKHHCWYK